MTTDSLNAALLSGAKDAERCFEAVSNIAFIDVDTLRADAGPGAEFVDDWTERMPVERSAVQSFGMQYEHAALRPAVGRNKRDFAAKLIRLMRLAFSDTFSLGRIT